MTQEQLELLLDYIDYKVGLAAEPIRSWNTDWSEMRVREIREALYETITGEQD